MSKLALLAQKRREEAQSRASPALSTPQHEMLQSPSSTPATDASASKPLSKLAQKMAAARAAKAEAAAKEASPLPTPSAEEPENAMELDETPGAGPSSLFLAAPRASSRPSTFFNLLTKHKHNPNFSAPSSEPTSNTSLHLPYVHDSAELDRRVQAAFGPGVESPDDIVLKARGGRAGTTAASAENGDSTAAKPKPVKAPAAPKASNAPSEASEAIKEGKAKASSQVHKTDTAGGRQPRRGSQSTRALDKPTKRTNGSSSKGEGGSQASDRPQRTKSGGSFVQPDVSQAEVSPTVTPQTRPAKPVSKAPRQPPVSTSSGTRAKAADPEQTTAQIRSKAPRQPSDAAKSAASTGSTGGEAPRGPPRAKPKTKSKVVQGPP